MLFHPTWHHCLSFYYEVDIFALQHIKILK
jgi:hypothetical protein